MELSNEDVSRCLKVAIWLTDATSFRSFDKHYNKLYQSCRATWNNLSEPFAHVYMDKVKYGTRKANKTCLEEPEWRCCIIDASWEFKLTLTLLWTNWQGSVDAIVCRERRFSLNAAIKTGKNSQIIVGGNNLLNSPLTRAIFCGKSVLNCHWTPHN